jgi:pimeloyl-ACP methyl ester carboxylesterase
MPGWRRERLRWRESADGRAPETICVWRRTSSSSHYGSRMIRVRPGYDWGERSERWAGVISDVADVGGVRAHYLRTDAAAAPADAPPHLLVHPLGAGSWSWMDVIRPLAAHGAVIVPDLPGAGRTRSLDPLAGRAEHGARFLGDLCRALDLDRVVLHGHSMGALVSALFAARHPERVARLVLTGPALPGLPDPPRYAWAWRLALRLAPRLARIPMRAGIRLKTDMWRRWRHDPTDRRLTETLARMGTDASRITPAMQDLIGEEIERYRVPWRIDGALQAVVSTLAALTVDEGMVRSELERIKAPTMVVWGDQDRLIPRRLVDGLMELHPDWDVRILDGIGHLLPVEAPETYVELVRSWISDPASGGGR